MSFIGHGQLRSDESTLCVVWLELVCFGYNVISTLDRVGISAASYVGPQGVSHLVSEVGCRQQAIITMLMCIGTSRNLQDHELP